MGVCKQLVSVWSDNILLYCNKFVFVLYAFIKGRYLRSGFFSNDWIQPAKSAVDQHGMNNIN